MANRMDALTARTYRDRDGNEKTSFSKIGVAFETKNGWAITLEALPLPTMGERGLETKILLMPPKEKQDKQLRREQGMYDRDDPRTAGSFSRELDDEVPF